MIDANYAMRETLNHYQKGLVLGLTATLLFGCSTPEPISLDSQAHHDVITEDVSALYPHISPASGVIYSLSLDDAINRALRYNLDARVAALETLVAKDNISLRQFEGAPNITGSGTFTKRNNLAASSSESILSGTESLEPSTSSEKLRRLADLKTQWNIIDSVIAYLNGESAEDEEVIAKERLRKVQQNIERDVIAAYWQAYSLQKSERDISTLSRDILRMERSVEAALGQKLIGVDDSSQRMARLIREKSTLDALMEQTKLGDVELKTITALPPDHDLVLVTEPGDFKLYFLDALNGRTSIDDLVQTALRNRPEMREAIMDKNIAVRDKERELVKTFPGLNLIYSRNYDSNRFLVNDSWTDFTAALTQSLSDFISLPTRYRAAENRQELEENKRRALAAAVIAQVHIGKIRIEMAQENYRLASLDAKQAERFLRAINLRQNMKAVSGFDSTVAAAANITKIMEKNAAYAALQEAYVDMIGTLGLSLSEAKEGGV